jgi:hypothetical protein
MPRAPETFTESEKKDYRQAAWQNILKGAASGATTGAGIGLAAGGAAAIPGAIIGGLVGAGLGLMEGANVRRGMREDEAAERSQELAAAQSARTKEAAGIAATSQKAAKRAGPKDSLAGQNLDVLAANMPSPGNSPSSGTGYDFIRSEYGWG